VPRPAIAICTPVSQATFGVWDQPAAVLPAAYLSAVERAGGVAVLVTPDQGLTDNPDELLGRVDGLILSGGADIDPACYGAEPHPATSGVRRDRDEFEIALTRRAIELDMPVLGVCRGMQILNVAFGGTLIQDLPEAFGHEHHRRVAGSFENADHDVRLTDDSLAAQAAGELVHVTKSHHHQGVDVVAEGLVTSGMSTLDELVEAIEIPGKRFVLGVQWHPEVDERSRVIAALVEAAAEYQAAREPQLQRTASGSA
jgi:putative glutamine amidotransferase